MADITLADYTGYIFREIIKARQMADVHSAQLAVEYAKDPVLKHFSVPRFKIPRMELTIPVLISGAQFTQTLVFRLTENEFLVALSRALAQAAEPLTAALTAGAAVDRERSAILQGRVPPALRESLTGPARSFHAELVSHPELGASTDVVRSFWRDWSGLMVRALRFTDDENAKYAEQTKALQVEPPAVLVDTLKNAAVTTSTNVQSLLINPETNIVKNGSSDTSVFTIKAEMLEEGFFIRTMKDEATGQETPVVEFE